MSDTQTTQASGQESASQQTATEATAEKQTAGDSQSQEQTGSADTTGQSQDQKQDQAASDNAKKSDDAGSGDKEQSKDSGQGEESKPKPRRSAQYRIQQLAKEANDWKAKYEQLAGKGQEQDQQDDGDQSQDDKSGKQPDISKQVSEEVNKRLEPVLKEHSKAADDAEINELFTGERAEKRIEYEPKIREAWKLDQYKDLAASDVFKILSYDSDLASAKTQAIEEYKKAEKEAKESSGSGTSDTSNRSDKGAKSVWDMSPEEFARHNEQIKSKL